MKTYSPTQVATVLEQRENVLGVLSHQQHASDRGRRLYYPSGSYLGSGPGPQTTTEPWVPHYDDECQAKYCHKCRPSCEPRTYLSLDGIVNGEIPATAATGFGFHRTRERPIVDARLVREIGLRPVPWPQAQSREGVSSPASLSTLSLSDIAEFNFTVPDYVEEGLGLGTTENPIPDKDAEIQARISIFERPRPAHSPPPTPISWTGIAPQENGTTLFENYPWECDGRSSQSLRTNYRVCRQVVRSIAGLVSQFSDEDKVNEPRPISLSKSPDESESPEPGLDSKESHILAESSGQGTTAPTIAEELAEELVEGYFHPDPLNVGDGIAVLEESVELGVPDVITQM